MTLCRDPKCRGECHNPYVSPDIWNDEHLRKELVRFLTHRLLCAVEDYNDVPTPIVAAAKDLGEAFGFDPELPVVLDERREA